MQDCLQLSHNIRVEGVIAMIANVKLCDWIMDVELSILCDSAWSRNKRSRKMVKIALNAKAVWTCSTCNRLIYLYTQRCKCECRVILSDIGFELLGQWTSATQQISQSTWSRWEFWQLNLPLHTAASKLWYSPCRFCQLLTVKMQGMALRALHSHRSK